MYVTHTFVSRYFFELELLGTFLSFTGYLVNKINKTIADPTSYDGGNQYVKQPTTLPCKMAPFKS